jgi:hypothetical protein
LSAKLRAVLDLAARRVDAADGRRAAFGEKLLISKDEAKALSMVSM